MALKGGEVELDVVDGVLEAVRGRLGHEPSWACTEFVRQFFHWVPAPDLRDRSVADLAGAALCVWEQAARRPAGETRVRVYDPEPDRDGWASPFTVLDVLCDDMPFVVDSLAIELTRRELPIELLIHPVVRTVRGPDGVLADVIAPEAQDPRALPESVIHVELARPASGPPAQELAAAIERVLAQVRAATRDAAAMRERAGELEAAIGTDGEDAVEGAAFLRWLTAGNFVFLGARDHVLDGPDVLRAVPGSGLGLLREEPAEPVARLTRRAAEEGTRPGPLVFGKSGARSAVHRPVHLDLVGVKRRDPDGRVIGERRLFGLYTPSAEHQPVGEVPVLRERVARILHDAGFPPDSHDAKALVETLESLPRDVLLLLDVPQLFSIAMGIVGLGERPRVRLFAGEDRLERFAFVALCLPRERLTTGNARRASRLLAEAFGADDVDWTLSRAESVVVRVDYALHCAGGIARPDLAALEARIARSTRAWEDELRAALVRRHGERRGLRLHGRYADAFPGSYRALTEAADAVDDVARLEQLAQDGRPTLEIRRRPGDPERMVRARLLSAEPLTLSELVPSFEHMGARVLDERPFEIAGGEAWLYDVGIACDPVDLARAGERFAQALLGVWSGELEDDRLGGLVLRAGLSGRDVTILRAVLRYLRQAVVPFSDSYMITALLENPEIAARLVALFRMRFDPDETDDPTERATRAQAIHDQITAAIDAVSSLDADRILSAVLAVLDAMLRTNHYCEPVRSQLSFKLDPTRLPMLPLPRPRFEIFVYSPRVEGIHLRGGRVARGGLRWSDRREDFRTEVLGLMKAQMVKNALIVPVGSKGGFVVKRGRTESGDAQAQLQEGIECYRTFLHGLLDLTDNYVGDAVLGPARVLRYDEDDPYLVVAADKGTARFSDIANAVSAEYGFWLGDAFASGGSHGYDHKAMGITARGAWESVKRHFRELGIDVAVQDFTVVGIGDMAGDVFGNGMLRSPHIRLVAAFNHAHVFLDPDPDPAAGFAERRRLFELPRSSWEDYDRSLISPGGGVFSRTAKSIPLSAPVRAALGLDEDCERLAPDEVVAAILRAPVDLLWNGGIGTYVKAAGETDAEVGDRANDPVRIDGGQLRCRVVAEGGNLGLTQRGRIEFALRGGPREPDAPAGPGGLIYTDAIDNVAGVNCSDHEVNIKILLGDLIADGKLPARERDAVLSSMTDAVAEEVLYGSYTQTQALSLALGHAGSRREVHARLLRHLETHSGLDREIEVLPSDEVLAERRAQGRGLLAPELAVLMAHVKIALYEDLLDSDLPDDPYLHGDLERYFPAPLGTGSASADRAPAGTEGAERYAQEIRAHRLRRELVATIVANQLVDRGGSTVAFRLWEELGAGAAQLARGFAVAREVFRMRDFWDAIEDLDGRVAAEVQNSMLMDGRRLVERATRWLCRARARAEIDVTRTAHHFAAGADALYAALPGVLTTRDAEAFAAREAELRAAGVVPELARRVAAMGGLLSTFDIVEESLACGATQAMATQVYFGVGERLSLDWLRDRVLELPRTDRWSALARSALRDDLYELHRALTREIVRGAGGAPAPAALERWLARDEAAVARTLGVLADVRASGVFDTTTLTVLVREMKNLASEAGAPREGAGAAPARPPGGG